VFEEFRRAQIAAKDKATKDKQDEEVRKKMEEMAVNKYKPPSTYMEQQKNDPAFFNYQYAKYANDINNGEVQSTYDNK
jgi:hypothetical protein